MSTQNDPFDDEDSELFRIDRIRSHLVFALRAVRKRRLWVLGVFAAVSALTLGVLTVYPRTYHCETKLLAERMPVLSFHGDQGADVLRGASDLILRRDNLVAIAKQTDLVQEWKAHRAPILELKDRVAGVFGEPQSADDALTALVGLLEARLAVYTGDGTITIVVDWPDATMSARLVDAATRNFLESRHVAEISTIAEFISILEGHAVKLREEIDTVVDQAQKVRDDKLGVVDKAADKAAPARPAALAAAPARHGAPRSADEEDADVEAARLKVVADAKRRAISELEDFRTRRLAELEGKLSEARSKYTAAHPVIVDLEQNMAALSHESPQVTALRGEVADLESRLRRSTPDADVPGGLERAPGSAAAVAGPLPTEVTRLIQEGQSSGDPAIDAQLRYAVEKYTHLRSEISTARIELDTAQAAFKHRYKIIVPPEVPDHPVKPRVKAILAAGMIAGLVLGLLAAFFAEVRRGRLAERWQVERLALPVLGELRFPPGRGQSPERRG